MTLPCGCEAEPDHRTGERLISCQTHRRSFAVRARTTTVYDAREVTL